ncbi:hypothetical protein NQ317_013184 [Molorchus minor]|uniref:Tyr recombinase domain-containing protein n=1 Tax=Molorchus minor TaxID=1323400 RepID=A0ABQ9IR14_9CUCU|nr:hypothetical protein NQ317_013184 [Molorchus minor]
MSDSEFECTPPEVRVAAERATEGIIPEKSRERYENTYELYSKWCVAKANKSKASTLWSRYSMLRAVLNFRHNVDISNYAKLKAFLKRKNVGYQAKKSSVFSEADIDTFLNNAPIEYLPQKVALIIGISGACRCDELLKMKISDLDILENRIIIVIPVTKTYSSRTFTYFSNIISKYRWRHPTVEKLGGWKSNTVRKGYVRIHYMDK